MVAQEEGGGGMQKVLQFLGYRKPARLKLKYVLVFLGCHFSGREM